MRQEIFMYIKGDGRKIVIKKEEEVEQERKKEGRMSELVGALSPVKERRMRRCVCMR